MTRLFLFLTLILFFFIGRSQNVGVGTFTPTHKLHIVDSLLNDPLRIQTVNIASSGDTLFLVSDVDGIVRYRTYTNVLEIINNQISNSTTNIYNSLNDSLLSNPDFRDSLFVFIADSLLNDSDFLSDLKDSIDTDVDTLYLNNSDLSIIEDFDTNTVDLALLALDSSFIDNLLSNIYFYDSIYSMISDSILNDTSFLISLATDSVFTSTLATDSNFVTTLASDTTFTNSLVKDSVFTSLLSANADPTGSILTFAGLTPPTGYLFCDGSAVSRVTYSKLFGVIGTMYGIGDGSTTFNLPDIRGQFIRGWDNGAANDPNSATRTDRGDGSTGDNIGTKQASSNASHNHSVDPPSTSSSTAGAHTHAVDPPNTNTSTNGNHRHTVQDGDVSGGGDGIYIDSEAGAGTGTDGRTDYAGNHLHSVNIGSFNSGSSGNHSHTTNIAAFSSANSGGSESRPVNIYLMYCIKY